MLGPAVLESLPNRILETSIYKWGEGEIFPIYRFLFQPEDPTGVTLARECPSPGALFPFPPPPETIFFLLNPLPKSIYFKARMWFHLIPLSSCLLPPGIACGLGPDELQLGLQIYEVLFQCQRLLVVNSEQNRYLSPDTSCWPPSYFFKLFIKTTHTLQRKRETGSLCRGSRWHRSEPQTVFLNSPFPGSLCPAPVFFFFFDRKKKKSIYWYFT